MTFDTAQSLYAALLREHVGPHVRALWFTGSAGKFRRRVSNGWHLLDFQKSYHSSSAEVHATVNVIAVGDAQWAARVAWYAASAPAVKVPDVPRYGFVHGQRMGILRTGIDDWYTLRPADDVGAWAERILGDIDQYALPYLERELPQGG